MPLADSLVNAVNPRLVRYGTSVAWKLALLILIANYGAVVVLGFQLTSSCSSTSETTVENKVIVTDADSQTAQIRNLRNEDGKVVRNGGVTITTSVQACVVATKEKLLVKDKYDEQVIATDPCWPYVECASGSGGRRLDDDRRHLAYAPIQVPAGFPAHQMFDPAQPASPDNLPCHTPNTVFERHKKVYFSEDDVMQWCNDEQFLRADDLLKIDRGASKDKFVDRRLVMVEKVLKQKNTYHGELRVCGDASYFMSDVEYEYAVRTTRDTTTCPTLAVAMGSAFGYLSQIEIAVTLVVLLVFNACLPKASQTAPSATETAMGGSSASNAALRAELNALKKQMGNLEKSTSA